MARRSEDPQLRQFLGREMLRGAFAAVASAGPNQQAELLHLARDILAMDTPFPAAPREVVHVSHILVYVRYSLHTMPVYRLHLTKHIPQNVCSSQSYAHLILRSMCH